MADEETWVVPDAWWKQAEPIRGLGPERKPVRLAPDAAEKAEELRNRPPGGLTKALDNRNSDPVLVEHARAHLAGEPDPLGATTVAAVTAAGIPTQHRAKLTAVVDALVSGHGPEFAAEVCALAVTVRVQVNGYGGSYNLLGPVRRNAGGPPGDGVPALLARMRQILAGCDDPSYGGAVGTLETMRSTPLLRATTSYLLPARRDWVEATIAEITAGQAENMAAPVLTCATTLSQAQALLPLTGWWGILGYTSAQYSLAAHVGPPAAQLLDGMLDRAGAADRRRILGLIGGFPTDEAFDLLVARLGEKHVATAVREAAGRYPLRARRLLAAAATGPNGSVARELLAGLEKPATAHEAAPPPDAVPALLVSPPWTKRKVAPKPVVLDGLAAPDGVRVTWRPGEREEWAATELGRSIWDQHPPDWPVLVAEILAGGPVFAHAALAAGPEDVVRPLLSTAPTTVGSGWWLRDLRRILGRFDLDGAGFVTAAALTHPPSLAVALLPIEDPRLAPRMAEWLARLASVRPAARAWLLRHPHAAAAGLVPPALGRPGPGRSHAEAALRFLAAHGQGDAVRAAAEAFGPAAAEGVAAALAVDALDLLPARMPALPAWLDVPRLPAVRLGRDGALPPGAVANLCLMLLLCRPGEPYAGVEAVRTDLDARALAELAWALFQQWRESDYPSKDAAWVLEAVALVGDDEVVRRLSPLIRAWPAERANTRAINALEVLASIGTDVALMHLHGIAERAAFKTLKARAQEMIAEIAASKNLTPDQLADRLIPDLGLDARGTMLLDYGPRRFRVSLDEALRPTVADEDGSPRNDLPKPGAKDDATLAQPAYERFAALRKDARTIASDQIRRLERAMVAGRRWTPDEHRTFFVEHPLVWHLTRRLVWATFSGAEPTGSFRVAEDRTLADSDDVEVTPEAGALVGIAHPLRLSPETLRAWRAVFADYEILQPFPQLDREVYALTDVERSGTELTRFQGAVVGTGRLLALSTRGWERGARESDGDQFHSQRHLGGNRYAVVSFEPGIPAYTPMEVAEQTIERVWLSDGVPAWDGSAHALSFGELDAVTASEILRDLETLRG